MFTGQNLPNCMALMGTNAELCVCLRALVNTLLKFSAHG